MVRDGRIFGEAGMCLTIAGPDKNGAHVVAAPCSAVPTAGGVSREIEGLSRKIAEAQIERGKLMDSRRRDKKKIAALDAAVGADQKKLAALEKQLAGLKGKGEEKVSVEWIVSCASQSRCSRDTSSPAKPP